MARYGSLPFDEQIKYFRDKVNVPTRTWRDIERGAHSRAFVVAGAMREELLADFRAAVGKAIESGTSLQEFRRDFKDIVKRRGWTGWTGEGSRAGNAWRTRVIYETNLRTSYAAGRWQQMQEAKKTRPYWRYRHSFASEDPREEHMAWDGLILPADDPWWNKHYPPNDWGCKCYVETLSEADMERLGKQDPDKRPTEVDDTAGVGEGWDYNPGQTAWGQGLSEKAMSQWQSEGANAWAMLGANTAATYNRPSRLPADKASAERGRKIDDRAQVESAIKESLGGDEVVLSTPAGTPVLVNAHVLARHMDESRTPFIPHIKQAIENPYEQWVAFEQHKGTGKVVMRSRLISVIDDGSEKGMLLVANATGGKLEAYTLIPVTNGQRYLERQRRGMLLYGRDD